MTSSAPQPAPASRGRRRPVDPRPRPAHRRRGSAGRRRRLAGDAPGCRPLPPLQHQQRAARHRATPRRDHRGRAADLEQPGRRVRKGEKGIAILAPCTYRPQAHSTPAAQPPRKPRTAPTREIGERRVLRGFRVAYASTSPRPTVTRYPRSRQGRSPGIPQLSSGTASPTWWRRTATGSNADPVAAPMGTPVHRRGRARSRRCLPGAGHQDTRSRGRPHPRRARHSLRRLLPPRHSMPRHRRGGGRVHRLRCRRRRPAWTPSDYTVPYVAHWSAGDRTIVRDTATRVIATARAILRDTHTPPAERTPDRPASWRSSAVGAGHATAGVSTERAGPNR